MAVNPVRGGTTDPAVGNHTYNAGTVVDIKAIPALGFRFVNWTGDVADPGSASTKVRMDGDKTATANFAPRNYTLTMAVNPDDGGTTDPAVGDHIYDPGTVVGFAQTIKAGVGGHLYQVRVIFYLHRGSFHITDLHFAQFRSCPRHRLSDSGPLEHTTDCHDTTCRG